MYDLASMGAQVDDLNTCFRSSNFIMPEQTKRKIMQLLPFLIHFYHSLTHEVQGTQLMLESTGSTFLFFLPDAHLQAYEEKCTF